MRKGVGLKMSPVPMIYMSENVTMESIIYLLSKQISETESTH